MKSIINYKQLIAIIIALVIASFVPVFVTSPYYLDLVIVVIVNTVLAITFIMLLRTGLISLGIVAFWGTGAYASAVLVMKLHLSFWIGLPAAAAITGIVALILGFVLIGSGSSGFTFVILSAVVGMLFTVVVGSIPAVGGYNGMSNIPAPNPINIPFLPEVSFVSKVQYYYLALFLLLVVVIITKAFYSAWTGRAWTAISLSPRLAESIGINIFRYKLMVFVLASGIAGLIGSFYAHYEGFVIPNTFGMWQNIYIQLYAILGGIGYSALGPLVGATVMTFVPEFLRVASIIAPIITGSILILLILFLPRGLLGVFDYARMVLEKILRPGISGNSAITKDVEHSPVVRGKVNKA